MTQFASFDIIWINGKMMTNLSTETETEEKIAPYNNIRSLCFSKSGGFFSVVLSNC